MEFMKPVLVILICATPIVSGTKDSNPRLVIGIERHNATLNCFQETVHTLYSREAQPRVMWFFKECSSPVSNDTCDQLVKEGHWTDELLCPVDTNSNCWNKLTLRNVTAAYNGLYTCYLYSWFKNIPLKGRPLNTFHFQVYKKNKGESYEGPKFLSSTVINQTATAMGKADIQFRIKTILPITVYWFKLLQETSPNSTVESENNLIYKFVKSTYLQNSSNDTMISILSFPYVSTTDAGTYMCLAFNELGSVRRKAHLVVLPCEPQPCKFKQYLLVLYLFLLCITCLAVHVLLYFLLKSYLMRLTNKIRRVEK